MTLDELRRERRPTLPAKEVLPLFGTGRSAGYEAIRCGAFPVTPLRVGHRLHFATAEIQRVLGLAPDPPKPSEARHHQEPLNDASPDHVPPPRATR